MGVGGWAECLALPGRSERDLLTRFGGGGGAGSPTQEEPEQEGNWGGGELGGGALSWMEAAGSPPERPGRGGLCSLVTNSNLYLPVFP